jgi:hypothetical protein
MSRERYTLACGSAPVSAGSVRRMLELYFMLIVVPKRIRALASTRAQSAAKWTFKAIATWVLTEVALFFAAVGSAVALSMVFGLSEDTAQMIFVVGYIIAVAGGMWGADLVAKRLESLPEESNGAPTASN